MQSRLALNRYITRRQSQWIKQLQSQSKYNETYIKSTTKTTIISRSQSTRSTSSILLGKHHRRNFQSSTSELSSASTATAVRSSEILDDKEDESNGLTPSSSISSSSSSVRSNHVLDDQVLELTKSSIDRLLQEEIFSVNFKLQTKNPKPSASASALLETMEDEKEMEEETLLTNISNRTKTQSLHKPKISMAELLAKFDPQSPPPDDASLYDVQQWLECSAQQESVEKYEAIIENARLREDYASMSVVQRHLLDWYTPLREMIAKEQEMYYSTKRRKKGSNKYGPFLCTLQAEKLAVLTTHEATVYALKKGGDGATLVGMAVAIGNAVEAEINVQRLLKQRMEQNRKINTMSYQEGEQDEDDVEDVSKTIKATAAAAALEGDSSITSIISEKSDVESKEGDENEINESRNNWMYGPSHLQRFIDELNRGDPSRKGKIRIERANRRAMQLLERGEPWKTGDKVVLGVVLIKMLLDTAKVNFKAGSRGKTNNSTTTGEGQPAFVYEKRWVNHKKLVGHVTMNEDFYKMIVEDKFSSVDAHTTRHKPMVIPPEKWTSPYNGGYTILKSEFMRAQGCQQQKEALDLADLSTVVDGLNVLGQVPWVINKHVLNAAQRCWDENISLGDIPSRTDFVLPPEPIRPDGDNKDYKSSDGEFRLYRESLTKYRRVYQKNMDLRSLRCSAILKLNQAQQFQNFERIYFPYNLDFRGRAYPVPPHLSNIGSDLCRGMLTFAESKPLGPRGLYWLKVHLANLAGNDKISFDERAAFTDDNMQNVLDCVNDPFGENRWWMTTDDPFQAMSVCHEIVAAIESGDPASFESSLPVHMDGSCNGLQHYAALGRDMVGGKAVNLCPSDKPQDVYSGVMHEVIRRVADEADRVLDFDDSNLDALSKNQKKMLAENRAAKLVNGLIDRGVVKRTVMTSVYGVTYIGAKKQIQEKIEEKLEGKGYDIDEMDNEIYAACGYLASLTMEVMGELFIGARQTMNWLATCARLISSQGQPVTWISPIGIPAVQPYRQKQPYTILTLLQTVVLVNNNDNLPIHKSRQASAFPPNYIHSLDSSHMLLTALEMEKRGLTFSAVHDSFWTHACDIDEMNDVLRSCFIDLYNKPLLEDLKKTWELQYPSLVFPELPEKGSLNLNEVKDASYFFQ